MDRPRTCTFGTAALRRGQTARQYQAPGANLPCRLQRQCWLRVLRLNSSDGRDILLFPTVVSWHRRLRGRHRLRRCECVLDDSVLDACCTVQSIVLGRRPCGCRLRRCGDDVVCRRHGSTLGCTPGPSSTGIVGVLEPTETPSTEASSAPRWLGLLRQAVTSVTHVILGTAQRRCNALTNARNQ